MIPAFIIKSKILKFIRMDLLDANNNDASKPGTNFNFKEGRSGEKYSLRQRQRRSNTNNWNSLTLLSTSSLAHSKSQNRNVNPPAASSTLSPDPEKGDKPKSKAAPLSKYRRKTANARERTRMREINSAFENLRKCVPPAISRGLQENSPCSDSNSSSTGNNEKLTKITTLRLAMKYINTLTEALVNPNPDVDFLMNINNNNNNNQSIITSMNSHFTIEQDEEILNRSDNNNKHHFIHKNKSNSGKIGKRAINNNVHKNLKQNNTKKIKGKSKQQSSRKNKREISKTSRGILSNPTTPSCTTETTTTIDNSNLLLTTAQMNSNSLLFGSDTLTTAAFNLISSEGTTILESDGESLHLSEPCLSPLSQNLNTFMTTGSSNSSSSESTSSYQNNLDFRMLFESDTDSLGLSDEQCLSPLTSLDDAFNPFADLLHSEFSPSEQSNLEMYLT